MYIFKVTLLANNQVYQVNVLGARQCIENGDLIILDHISAIVDTSSAIVAAFAKGAWIDCIRSVAPESI